MSEFRIYKSMEGKYRAKKREGKHSWSWLTKMGTWGDPIEFDTLQDAHIHIQVNYTMPPLGEVWELVHEVDLT